MVASESRIYARFAPSRRACRKGKLDFLRKRNVVPSLLSGNAAGGSKAGEFKTIMKTEAFTRVELLVSLSVVGLLGMVAVSVCADTRERSERIMCMNNQRLIGRGFNAWAAEHGGENPWWVSASKGGTKADGTQTFSVPGGANYPAAIVNNAWFQFIWIYEELPTPSVLTCPSDPVRQRASDFSSAPGGLAHVSMQNNAVSYLIGAHAVREWPSGLLSADRHMTARPGTFTCSSGLSQVRWVATTRVGGEGSSWTNILHGATGNVLMNDGRVEQMTISDLNAYLDSGTADDNGSFHLLFP
jgi:hypothetical protein